MKDPELLFEVDFPPPSPLRPWYRISVRRALGLILGVACVLAVAVWFVRAVESAREAARRAQCVCNFCQITLALHNYESTYGTLPPAHLDDASGKPMHSWRVLILPFMEQNALYSAYNFSEPWDGPSNRKLLNSMPPIYSCPSRNPGVATNLTSYVAVTGPGTAFPDGRTVAFQDIKDGTSYTVIAVEIENVDIPWTEPRDLDVRTMSFRVNDPKHAGVSSRHPGGANITFADGGKRFLREGVTPGELRAQFTIDGGEKIDVDAALSRK